MKVPYIPLYIGDWEQDTNCLSLSAEAAWLKIIFKMFKNDKNGIYKTSTKSLQNLWKTDTKGVQEILNELSENNICDLEISDIITFTNRRMVREREISEIRTKAVQKRYKTSTNNLQNSYKSSTKVLQNPEYENEYENDIDNENIQTNEKTKKTKMPEISEMLNFAKTEIEKLGHDFSKFEYPMKSKIETWQENGWKDGHNKPIKNWKSKIKNIIPFLKPMAAPQNQILEKGLEEARKNFVPTSYTPRNIEKELEIARNNFKPTEYVE